MAKATIRYVEREKVVTERVEDGVTLELSSTEAEHLARIIGHISGTGSLRKTVDSLWEELLDVVPANLAMKPPFKGQVELVNCDKE